MVEAIEEWNFIKFWNAARPIEGGRKLDATEFRISLKRKGSF